MEARTFERDKSPRAKGKCLHCGRNAIDHISTDDGQDNACDPSDVKRHTTNVKRRAGNRARSAAIRDAYSSVGMKRVKGSQGGTYYE